jgi:hypothetical protein
MAGRQKSREPDNLKRAVIIREAEGLFSFRLSCVDTIQEAKKLAGQGSKQNENCEQYYANLAIFLESEFKQLPPLVSKFEKQLYADLIGRLVAGGEVKDGAKAITEGLLKSAAPKAVARSMADRVAGRK